MTALLAAELLKLRTVRSTWLLLLVVPVAAGMTYLDATFDPAEQNPDAGAFVESAMVVVTAGIAAFAATMVGAEFSRRMVSYDYLAVPTRLPVLGAKLIALGAYGLVIGGLSVAASHAVAMPFVSSRELTEAAATAGARLASTTVAIALLTAIGAAIGILARNPTIAVVVVLLWQPVELLVALTPPRRRPVPPVRTGQLSRPLRQRAGRRRPGPAAARRVRRRRRRRRRRGRAQEGPRGVSRTISSRRSHPRAAGAAAGCPPRMPRSGS